MERLAEALVGRLRELPPDPVRPIEVVVGSKGMERWLRHEIAQRLGICANVSFLFPGRALQRLVGAALDEAEPAIDPWSADVLGWAVLEALPGLLDRPAFAPVRRYLREPGAPVDARGRALAREIADVLDRYVHYRPEWALAWSRGHMPEELVGVEAAGWQAELFRALRGRLGGEPFAERATRAAGGARGVEGIALHVFGVSSLPPMWVSLLSAFSESADLDLYLMCPSDLYWGELRTRRESLRDLRRAASGGARAGERARLADALRAQLARQNPLLSSLGRVSRDFQVVLESDAGSYEDASAPPEDEPAPRTLLEQLQADVRALASPVELREDPAAFAARAALVGDGSVRVFACHGPTRQVEVLSDALHALFAERPDLQPRDVVILAPDVATWAPLVEAALGRGRDQPDADGWGPVGAPRIPLAVADRGLRATNPVADAVLRVLDLVGARATASAVLDLLALEPVRARFGIDESELPTLGAWVRDSGARWAVDADERAAAGQPRRDENTWRFGLGRLALGVVMPDADDRLWAGVAPFDDLEGADTALFGRLAAFCDALFAARRALEAPRALPAWLDALRGVVEALCDAPGAAGWMREQVFEELARLGDEAAAAGFGRQLDVGAVRDALDGRFEVARRGDRPVTGAVTLCALAPMRSVPFRVVCLLGLDDGAFPRAARGLGFDLLAAAPRTGDRDPRDEDRHLLLEALLSARETLLVSYTGRDARTNLERPPCVPLAELLDVLDASFPAPEGRRVRDALTLHPPLQPFSPRAFRAGAALGFDRRMLWAAGRLGEARAARGGLFASGSIAPPAVVEIDVDELAAFLRAPARSLLRRLGLYLRDEDDTPGDREPVELDGLSRWQLGDRLLGRGRGVVDWEAAHRVAVARGELPLGGAGRLAFAERRAVVEAVLAAAGDLLDAPPADVAVGVDVAAPAGVGGRAEAGTVRVVGRVGGVRGEQIVELGVEDPDKPRRLLGAWVRLLAARASGAPVVAARAFGVKAGAAAIRTLRAPADARERLTELVGIYLEGQIAPVPLLERGSLELVRALKGLPWDACSDRVRDQAIQKAEAAWEDAFLGAGEGADPWNAALWPSDPPIDDEVFPALAERVWAPLLDALEER